MSASTVEAAANGFQITGKTRVLGILADPVAHVKAPPRINQIALDRGRDAVIVPFHVAPDDLPALVSALRLMKNFDGAIVTVPHKGAIVKLCERISDEARVVGAVNIIRREDDGSLVGDVLDGRGFVAGLAAAGIEPAGKRVHLTGAGGAASAVAFALARAGIAALTLVNRSRDKAAALRGRLAEIYPGLSVVLGSDDPSGHDLVVNGTSLGMRDGDPLPLDAARLTPGMIVAEVVMEPALTPLLAVAGRCGCTLHFGKPMLDHQLELMADFLKL